jgi:hypothetical protein
MGVRLGSSDETLDCLSGQGLGRNSGFACTSNQAGVFSFGELEMQDQVLAHDTTIVPLAATPQGDRRITDHPSAW